MSKLDELGLSSYEARAYRALVSLAATLYDEADESVRSAMSVPYEAVDWETYAAEIDASLDGVVDTSTARVLVTPGVLDGVPEQVRDEYTDSPPTVEIRTTTELRITFDVVDERRVCFHVPHPTGESERLGVIDFRDDSLAAQLAATFDDVWARARHLG